MLILILYGLIYYKKLRRVTTLKIDSMTAGSGRRLKENDQVVNIADLIEQIANSGVTLTGSNVTDITFHNEAVAAADGAILTVGTNKTLTIEIYGTSTSRTIAFIGRSASGEDRALSGVKLNGLSVATGTTGSGELWQFDITGLTSVFIDLQAVAGGNVSIKGKAVA